MTKLSTTQKLAEFVFKGVHLIPVNMMLIIKINKKLKKPIAFQQLHLIFEV